MIRPRRLIPGGVALSRSWIGDRAVTTLRRVDKLWTHLWRTTVRLCTTTHVLCTILGTTNYSSEIHGNPLPESDLGRYKCLTHFFFGTESSETILGRGADRKPEVDDPDSSGPITGSGLLHGPTGARTLRGSRRGDRQP